MTESPFYGADEYWPDDGPSSRSFADPDPAGQHIWHTHISSARGEFKTMSGTQQTAWSVLPLEEKIRIASII